MEASSNMKLISYKTVFRQIAAPYRVTRCNYWYTLVGNTKLFPDHLYYEAIE